MGDCIERGALLATYRKWLPQLVSEEDAGDRRGVETCIKVLEQAPAADVVELPCKIGDVVWTYLRSWRHEDGIAPYQITNLTITQNKKGLWTKKYRAMWLVDGKTRDWSEDFAFDEIGKRVFLSQEAAERELMNCGNKS